MNIGIWIRVSTEEQAQGESPKNHEHRARMYAELKGWHVVELYDLSGVSGKSVIEQPEAKRMLADVASGKIQVLIFSKLARIARNVRELLEISDHFERHNANLVSLEESIDTSSAAGRLLFTVIGALAQWEREEISARVSASVPIRARQGKPTGGKGPFGYMWVDKQLVVNPSEAVTVKEIYKTYLETKKLLTTAKILNEKGYRTSSGAKFGKTTIKRILTDPTFMGMKRANYSTYNGSKRKSWTLKPKAEWVYFEVEPIIAKKEWEEANAIIRHNALPYPTTPPPVGKYAFSGILRCGHCSKPMYMMKYPGMTTCRYTCRQCLAKISEDVLFEQFKEGLKCMVINPENLQETIRNNELIKQQKTDQLKTLKSELKTMDRKIESLLDLLSDGTIDRTTFSEQFEKLKERKNRYQKKSPGSRAK